MRRPNRLTLSKIELAGSCLYSFRPDVEVPKQEFNPAADRGTQCHEHVKQLLTGSAYLRNPDAWVTDNIEYWHSLPTLCMPEVAFAVRDGVPRILGVDIDRKYEAHGATDADVCGSADVIAVSEGVLYVYDWKFGRQHYLTRIQNPQVRAYAACAARVLGFETVRAVTVVVNDQGVQEYIDDQVDISDTLMHISALDDEALYLSPEPQIGSHCGEKYCDLRATCPAVTKARNEIVRMEPLPLASVQDVAVVIEKLVAAKAQIKAIQNLVDRRVDELGDIPLSNGKTYGLKEETREALTCDDAANNVLEHFGLSPERKVSLTKEAVKAAIKKTAPKGEAAAMERSVMGALRETGSLVSKTTVSKGIK